MGKHQKIQTQVWYWTNNSTAEALILCFYPDKDKGQILSLCIVVGVIVVGVTQLISLHLSYASFWELTVGQDNSRK